MIEEVPAQVWLTTDVEAYLQRVGDFLAAEPVRNSVIASTAERVSRATAAGTWTAPEFDWWFGAVIASDDRILGAAMRTHPTSPHPVFIGSMPPAAVTALAKALRERAEPVTACNGDRQAGAALLTVLASGSRDRVEVLRPTRLWELTEVVRPSTPPGRLRTAGPEELELCLELLGAFHADAAAQAGQAHDPDERIATDRVEAVARDIAEQRYWLWEVDGAPVHLTGLLPPAFGVSRIAPVYTPPQHRGRGYASHVVAALSRRVLDSGARVCLYTDLENPVSNLVYERIGYRPVYDEAELRLVP